MSTRNSAIEVGDTVNVLSCDSWNDGLSGPAKVLRVDGDDIKVSLINQNWEGWFHVQRIKR